MTRISRHVFGLSLMLVTSASCLSSADDPGADDPSADDPSTDVLPTPVVNTIDADYVQTPIGGIHKSCFHVIGDNDVVDANGAVHSADGQVSAAPAPCAFPRKLESTGADTNLARGDLANAHPPTDNGWTEDALWISPVSIKLFQAQFHVPAAPSVYTGQLLYLFPALVDPTGGNIIQPVLQYGPSPAGGGNYWAIASWFGGNQWGGHYFSSSLRRVTTGEVISGQMRDTGVCHPTGCQWNIAMHNSKNTANLTISVINELQWRRVYAGAIEVYHVNSCSKYPRTYDNFFSFLIKDYAGHNHTAAWTHQINVHTCGEKITSNSGLVNLYY